VLASGEGAVLSHESAAQLWGIRPRPRTRSGAGGSRAIGGGDGNGRGGPAPVHVTSPSTVGKRRRNGIILHRTTTLTARDWTRLDGIPVTRPARTLSDLIPLLSPAQINAAVREAEFLHLPVGEFSARRDRPGRARTELESRMLAICRRHRLPQPEINVKLDRFEVDFLWRAERLVVEVDGWASHRTRSAFEEDRVRDVRLSLLGYRVVRFTWRRLADEPADVARAIRALVRVESARPRERRSSIPQTTRPA
jgi:very-short-patch-repair endonuclease